MANPLQIQNKSKLIEEKARSLFLRIKKEYESGEIASETEYLYKLYHGLQEFYTTIGKATMKKRPAWGPPYSEDYNQMMEEIHDDLYTLYQETEVMAKALNDGFRQTEIDRQSLSNRLKRIEDGMQSVALKLNQTAHEVIFRDSFIDQQKFDKERVKGTPANIWTREGLLTLQPTQSKTYSEGAVIRILDGNGMPGTTKQVRSLSGALKFVGEDNLHISLPDILDGNSDTWFEYETFEVSEKTIRESANLGFAYAEGIKWIIEQGEKLHLAIQIELPYAQTVNWFSLNPFIPNDKGAGASYIRSIKIEDGKGTVTEVAGGYDAFKEEKVYMFSRQDCKRITILLEQPTPYETSIGHLFFRELEESRTSLMDQNRQQLGKRVDGEMPSIENLGVQYDPAEKKVVYPESVYGSTMTGIEKKKQNLFTIPETDGRIQAGFEEMKAWRYVIGIRDASISTFQFVPTGEYISTPYQSKNAIIGMTLSADVDIPKEFPEGEWVKYSISVDGGQSYHSIHPRGTSKEGAKVMYLFNQNTPQEGRIEQFGYVDTFEPIREIRLKIELSRPKGIPDIEYYTPMIRDYRLHVITQGEE